MRNVFETQQSYQYLQGTPKGGLAKMTDKNDKEHLKELKEMIQDKKPAEPIEKVLTKFCARHGVSMGTCRVYYDQLKAQGEVKEE